MFMNKEKKMAKRIVQYLNKRGFIAKEHHSRTSKSIYIKIDNGVIPVIRVSDHKRVNDGNCKYNVIKNYKGPKYEIVKGKMKKYYTFKNLANLITDIELERHNKIMTLGYSNYRNILEGKKTGRYNKYLKAA